MTNFRQWSLLTGYRRLIVYVVKCQMSQKNIDFTYSYKYTSTAFQMHSVCSRLIGENDKLKKPFLTFLQVKVPQIP
jgi:hypothetical protein